MVKNISLTQKINKKFSKTVLHNCHKLSSDTSFTAGNKRNKILGCNTAKQVKKSQEIFLCYNPVIK